MSQRITWFCFPTNDKVSTSSVLQSDELQLVNGLPEKETTITPISDICLYHDLLLMTDNMLIIWIKL